MMKCVLIILNYNDSHRALELAQKSKKYNNINRVVIVDNKSTDNSVEYLENQTESCDKIDILKARSNKGFAAGNNIGARYVTKKYQPEYILFANTDTIFEENDINECIKYMNVKENLGLVSMRIKDIKGNEERSAWSFKSFFEYAMFNIWLYRRLTYRQGVYTNFNERFQYVNIVRGSFMFFNASALEQVDFLMRELFCTMRKKLFRKSCRRVDIKLVLLQIIFIFTII